MTPNLHAEFLVSDVRFTAARREHVETGLLGWVTCVVNGGLQLDGLALRRTAAGRLAISFPARRDSSGREHPFVRPVSDTTRRSIEHQVFSALVLTQGNALEAPRKKGEEKAS